MGKCKCERCTSCDKYLKISYPRDASNFTGSRIYVDDTSKRNADGYVSIAVNKFGVDQFGKKYTVIFKEQTIFVSEDEIISSLSLSATYTDCSDKIRTKTMNITVYRRPDQYHKNGVYIDDIIDAKHVIDNEEYGYLYFRK